MLSAELYLLPISEASPAGENCNYDDAFTALSTLIENAPGGEIIPEEKRWALIGEKSQELLRNTSKHLTVASYCAASWLHSELLNGLTQGMQLLNGFCTQYWQTLYPERPLARLNSLNWYFNHASKFLQVIDLPALKASEKDLLQECYTNLKATVHERFPDESPVFFELDRILTNWPAESILNDEGSAVEGGAVEGANVPQSLATADAGAAAPANIVPPQVEMLQDPIESAFQRAMSLQSAGKAQVALQELVRGLQTACGGRERLRWRINLCRLMLGGTIPEAILQIHVDEISKAVADYKLADWEPELATLATETVCAFWKKAGKSDRVEECVKLLASLNPASALAASL